jgi:hypothetical protein
LLNVHRGVSTLTSNRPKESNMSPNKLLSSALVASSLLVAGAANANIQTVYFSPTANNNGQGAIGTAADFNAVGFQSNMSSTFTILGTSGIAAVTETGYLNLTSFQDAAANTVTSGVNSDYRLGATFTLTGMGLWTGNMITLNPLGASLNVNLYANGLATNPATGTLIGTASLDASSPAVAFAVAFGGLANGDSGQALTSLTAGLKFDPVADYTGPLGFFQAPYPLNIKLAIGNAGGNPINTGYSVSGTTVTIVNPVPSSNMGTANVTFVPEPGALALAGIALLGAAVASRRKAKTSSVA